MEDAGGGAEEGGRVAKEVSGGIRDEEGGGKRIFVSMFSSPSKGVERMEG